MANRAPEFTEGGSITRISTDAAGGQANYDSLSPVFSPDGTKVAFYSYASNLVSGDTNDTYDIFVKDLTTGAITRVSTDASGAQANGSSYRPVFSPDGTKVAFYSYGSNLVPGDTNGATDIFIKDLTTGVVTRVSTDGTGAQGNSSSYGPVFSPDGTKVAFYSLASNLVPNDTNGAIDIFVKDLLSGETIRIATNAAGAQGNDYSYQAVFSPDGTKVAFYSYASNLVAGDTNNNADIFIKDLNSGAVTLVSTDAAAIQGNSSSYTPVFSPDGTKVAFTSVATNLVPEDTNGIVDVFVKDLTTGLVTPVTADATGVQADSYSYSPQFSPDGTKVAFYSYASNLVPGDTNNVPDVFIKDLTTGAVTRLSTDADGAQGNNYSDNPVFSPDGSKVAFSSDAPNLVPGDTNGTTDIFIKDLSDTAATLTDADAKSSLTGAGKIFFTDADAGDSHTVSIAPQAGALGALTAVVVPVAGGASHVEWSYSVDTALIASLGTGQTHTETFTLTLDDGQGGTATRDVTVTLNGIDDAPVFTSPATVSFAENQIAAVLNVGAQDPEGAALTYALSGADAALFNIATNGTLTFKSSPDYEAPAGAGADNIYNVTVIASDGTLSTAKDFAVTVTDVAEINRAPVFTESGSITRISTDAAEGQADYDSLNPVFSPDGTKVAFYSYASNLVPGDTNGTGDVFVRDLTTGAITRVSTDASGAQANDFSFGPVFSPDGTKVAFSSGASNLVPGDTNGTYDIFVKDLTTGVVTRVSTDGTGAQENSDSYRPVFSPDGTKVAFYSYSTNLVPGDTNNSYDVFVKDLTTGTVTRVSTDASGTQGNAVSSLPVFSPDGTKVAFFSDASNLVPGDTNSATDVFVKDLTTGAVTRVSTDAGGIQANSDSYSYGPVFSPDGTKVAFYSVASNLAPGDTDGSYDIFVKDLTTGAVTRVSTDAGGIQANASSYIPTFSPDGTKVAFLSYASNLVPGDTNGTVDVFMKDLATGAVTRLSTDAAGAQANGYSDNPVFSPDGTKVAFNSGASNLVQGDTNFTYDIFVKDISPPSDTAATLTDAAAKFSLTGAGKIFFTDADAGDSHTVSIAPQAGALGALTAVVVPVAGGASHVDWSYSVDTALIAALGTGQTHTETFTLTLDDGQGGTATRDVTVTLSGINDAPVFTSPATVSFAERATGPVQQVAAQDPEGAALTYALSGTDASLFDLAADGTLTFKSAPDYEVPADAGADNIYNVTITASDGVLSTAQDVAVTVTDVAEGHAPVLVTDGGAITRISIGQGSENGNLSYSADGTKLVFQTTAPLVAGDTNNTSDIFVKDLTSGTITRVSTSAAGAQANGGSFDASLSADGTKVVFRSSASNLVAGDTNSYDDIFVKDLVTGSIVRVNTDASGAQGNGSATYSPPAISADGTKVVFSSTASNLVSGDTNGFIDVFIKDLTTGAISRISTATSGAQGNSDSFDPIISADGTKVAFSSAAWNFDPADPNSRVDIYVKDLTTGVTTLVSSGANGVGNGTASQDPVFSPDGTKIAFVSNATNLVSSYTYGSQIYLKDLVTGQVTLVSTGATGSGIGSSGMPVFSPDGTRIAFVSVASNFVAGDTNGVADIFVKDLVTGEIARVSTSATGVQGTQASSAPVFSPDGLSVAFASIAPNLVSNDTNANSDVFIKNITPAPVTSATLFDNTAQSNLSASGAFYFNDVDAGDAHAVTVTAGPGALGTLTANVGTSVGADRISWSYRIDRNLVAGLDAGETRVETYTLTIRDALGNTASQDVTVTLKGIEDTPVLSGPGAVTFAEGSAGPVASYVATDADGDAITYYLGGTDAHLFNLAADGTLSFKTPPSFDAPSDSGRNNIYELSVTATDGIRADSRNVTVTVADADLIPTFVNGSAGGAIRLVSADAYGNPGGTGGAAPVYSADGTKVAFYSTWDYASNDSNGLADIYVRDLATGAMTLVSTTSAGLQGNGGSYVPVFSADGSKIAFSSDATNLVAGDTNGQRDIFVKDLTTGAIARVSLNDMGTQGNGMSYEVAFSPDGTKLLLTSAASNLVPGDTNGVQDVFLKDLATGELTRLATGLGGAQANGATYTASFSPDGTKVVFGSNASNLVAGDTNGVADIFIKDLVTGEISVVSSTTTGTRGNSTSRDASFSPDGTRIVFSSLASNLVSGDLNDGTYDIYIKDLTTGAITKVSTNAAGGSVNGYNMFPVFSPDGTKIAFWSQASDLAPGDTNNRWDVFVKDLVTGEVFVASADDAGALGTGNTNSPTRSPSFSPDGTSLVFSSDSGGLVFNVGGGTSHVYIKDLPYASVTGASLTVADGEASLSTSGKVFFTGADAPDTHTVSVAAQGGALGTLTATVVEPANGAPRVDWSYSVDAASLASLAEGQSLTEVFTLMVDDGHGNVGTQDVTLTLTGINDAPVITAPSAVGFEENGSGLVLQVSATDADGDALTYGISGTDAALFEMSADGRLTFKSPPNFEAPADAGGDNVYDLILTASDGALTTQQALAVTVTDFAEPPSVLIGDAGANTLNGTTGADGIWAGAGNDTINGGGGGDLLFGEDGVDKLYGGSGNDTLTGGTGNDYLDGGSGNDTLVGGSGNDTYVVDAAGDVVVEASGGGIDTVRTAFTAYTLGSELENLVYTGTGGANFSGTGNGLDNAISGGKGNDTLDGGAGNDTLAGGLGNDTYIVDAVGDVVVEAAGEGTDIVRTSLSSYSLGANVESVTYTGSGNFTGTGNTLANTLKGGAGNDTLSGGAGNDTFYGLAGNDWLDGGTGNDWLEGGAGNDTYVVDAAGDTVKESASGGTDTVRTTLSSYTLGAEVENLTFTGAGAFTGTGNGLANVLTGGAGNDSLSGGAGNDVLDGGAGNDTLIGGTGDDTYVVSAAGDVVVEVAGGGIDTVRTALTTYTLGAELENLVYTSTGGANFSGTGNGLDNAISGGKANDTLDGGAGNDTLAGGLGNDIYIVDAAGDVVVEAAGEGTDIVRTSLASYSLGANVESVTYTGSGTFTGTGNTLDNTVKGGSGNDTLYGGAGNDTLYGLAGNDWLEGGTGNDWLEGGAGNDTYVLETGDTIKEVAGGGIDTVRTAFTTYTLGSELENLVYTGTGGANFSGTGNGLDNAISGGKGNDTLDGGAGNDTLAGGLGNDTYIVDAVGDVVVEAAGEGTDIVRTSLSSYSLGANVESVTYTGSGNFTGTGNTLANTLKGGAGNDTLEGGDGNDILYGLTGNDTLVGGLGADALFGAGGPDMFVYTDVAQSGVGLFDTIADFSAAEGDLIDLSAIDANSLGGTADDAFVYVGAAAFSGTAGELRFSGGQLQGDTNGDGTADLVIALSNTTTLSAGSIRL